MQLVKLEAEKSRLEIYINPEHIAYIGPIIKKPGFTQIITTQASITVTGDADEVAVKINKAMKS